MANGLHPQWQKRRFFAAVMARGGEKNFFNVFAVADER